MTVERVFKRGSSMGKTDTRRQQQRAGRVACQVPFCRRTTRDTGQDETICGVHWRLADRSLTRRYRALARWITRHKDDPGVDQGVLVRRWCTAARAWDRIKRQAIERAMGI